MTKTTSFASLLLLLPQVHAWLPNTQRSKIVTRWWAAHSQKAPEMESKPCWGDMYDDDCVMENAAAAGFVAAQWIKSMPCGEGIEDCDMPDDLKVPETRPEAGIDHVDVMSMLGVKRAKPIDSKK
mmetsp:Transcript_1580/g.3485  ORF Transcript_1580/g.3485 Transcript_1580/m.3485 type:complete len:125 (+) Transcript_1580:94-468(+)|eukprot:scaffold4241_cov164-Amphora_coffeaeformis.AAC.3